MHQYKKGERGQSLVEVALTLPILLMLLLGLFDLGRAYFILVELNDAADEGATYAAIRYTDVSGIQNRAVDAATMVKLSPGDVVLTGPPANAIGQPVTVTVSTDMRLFTPFVNTLVGGGDVLTLRGRAIHPIITLP
ncbi:MAG: TadE/TadG family type IV pilus assembly protein [Anaerolineae bacterium]|nr:TadE/TadG family type IV pilus assembly protein [Anaerolineae bacterium]